MLEKLEPAGFRKFRAYCRPAAQRQMLIESDLFEFGN
jgi:hypothetical protein